MDKNQVVIKIGGEAGFGIKVAGLMLSETLFEAGFDVFGYSEYPSLIQGGHNVYEINVNKNGISSATQKIDILVALNMESVELHQGEFKANTLIIHDGLVLDQSKFKEGVFIDVPLGELAQRAGGVLARNVVALGVVIYLLGLKLELFHNEIEKKFGDKSKKVVKMDKSAAKLGYEYAKNKIDNNNRYILNSSHSRKIGRNSYLMTANEAVALGMIQAGCKFYAAYPMTPSTSILHILAKKQREFDLVVHQTEDEISAIGCAIGAASTGVRSATGTSGGGFALMNESLGLAAITETPLVIVESQRTAPATGLPTWTEQGDLKYVINASHGEFPRIVIAPGDAEESFYMIQDAFNLAEKFQVVVILLIDKLLSESDYTVRELDIKKIKIRREGFLNNSELERIKGYKRYEFTATGISKRAVPGQKGGVHVINSDDHDEYGYSTEESDVRTKMMDKRFKKVRLIENELAEPKLYGSKSAKLTVVGWGSTKGAILDAMEELKGKDENLFKQINFLHITYIWPFPARKVKTVLKRAKKVLLVENNKTAQLGGIIREHTGIKIEDQLLKYDGRPFFREEIVKVIKNLIT